MTTPTPADLARHSRPAFPLPAAPNPARLAAVRATRAAQAAAAVAAATSAAMAGDRAVRAEGTLPFIPSEQLRYPGAGAAVTVLAGVDTDALVPVGSSLSWFATRHGMDPDAPETLAELRATVAALIARGNVVKGSRGAFVLFAQGYRVTLNQRGTHLLTYGSVRRPTLPSIRGEIDTACVAVLEQIGADAFGLYTTPHGLGMALAEHGLPVTAATVAALDARIRPAVAAGLAAREVTFRPGGAPRVSAHGLRVTLSVDGLRVKHVRIETGLEDLAAA